MSEEMKENGSNDLAPEAVVHFASREEAAEAIKKKAGLESADMSGLDLTEMKFTGLNAEGINLSNANLTSSLFAGINLEDADFSNAQMNGATIIGANLEKANLQGAQLVGATISAANLENSNLAGSDLSGSKWMGVNVEGADFYSAKTAGAKAAGVSWSEAKVPPEETPEAITPPTWLPAVIVAVMAFIVAIILLRKRGQVDVAVD